MKLRTIRDRLEERFVLPLEIDQAGPALPRPRKPPEPVRVKITPPFAA